MRMFRGLVAWPLPTLAAALLAFGLTAAAPAAPRIFWASDPVRPDETVLLQGCDFAGASVDVARLPDDSRASLCGAAVPAALAGGTPAPQDVSGPGESPQWARVPALQASESSLKFILPAGEKQGIFACRVKAGDAVSPPVLLNAPDPWWVQGDEGRAATPGGWLRIFGKSLHFDKPSRVQLQSESGGTVTLEPLAAEQPRMVRNVAGTLRVLSAPTDGDSGRHTECACYYGLRLALPASLKPGRYAVRVHNGFGGAATWRPAGTVRIEPPPAWPAAVFSVLDFYGKDAAREMQKTLVKYNPVPDRTEGIRAALERARHNGGGIVYFPAGRYGVKGPIDVPPRTVLKGEGTGVVVLWWGSGRFNLDGGGEQGLARDSRTAGPAPTLVSGREFGIEDMSLYFPLDHQTAIAAADRFRMRRVRIRIDHLWALDGNRRPEGTIVRLGDNFEVTDCDITAEGTGLVPGRGGLIARNRLLAGKTPCPLGGAREVICEDNCFVSTYPTAYMNIAGVGRNLYYARNRQEALSVHQADYSFTFDAGATAYLGKISAVDGTRITLAAEPVFPPWAAETSGLWKEAIVCIQRGRGAGQWRDVVAHHGRQWEIARAFDCPPDDSSIATIVPMNGRVLVVENQFEDANWVNAGYGTSIDVIYAGNLLFRCAQLMNYGLAEKGECRPSWYVQYFDNAVHEGRTTIDTTGSIRQADLNSGPITRCTIHRRQILAEDNSGGISVSGATRDVIVEGCVDGHPLGVIRVDGDARGVLLRNNRFPPGAVPRYEGSGLGDALVLSAGAAKGH